MIIVRPPRCYRPAQFSQEPAHGLTNRLELIVCIVSVGPFHVVRSSLEPPPGGLSALPRSRPDVDAPAGWTSIQHGAPQNVFDLRPQNFAARHGWLLPVRAAGVSDIYSGTPRQRRRRHNVDGREMAQRPHTTIGRTPRRDDFSLRPGLSRRSSSINPPVGRADHRARQAG